ncbi:MAG: alginate lyase family protein [Ferruginibacter sp.]
MSKHYKIILLFVCVVVVSNSCSKKEKLSGNSSTDTTPAIKYIDTLAPSIQMKHVGGLHTPADFSRIRFKVTAQAEPWNSGWNKLTANSHAQPGYIANPTVKLIRGGKSAEEPEPDNYARAMNDVAAAYQLGLRWKISGDTIYARTAINILNAWTATCTKLSGDPNVALGAGIYGYQFAIAGELLRDFSGWQPADFAKYKQWMLNVFYPINYGFLSGHFGCHPEHSWSNWDLCNMASAMAIGILTDNRSIYNYVINYYQGGLGNGNNFKTIFYAFPGADSTMAQMQESGRDQGHCTLSLVLLTTVCQLAWNQGDDLWGFRNNIVLKASEYVSKYNISFLAVPYQQYSWHEGDPWTGCGVKTTLLPEIGSSGRGQVRPMWAMIYNHYAKIKKVSAPDFYYTSLGNQKAAPEGGGGDFGPNSGGFDQLGFGTLLYTLE